MDWSGQAGQQQTYVMPRYECSEASISKRTLRSQSGVRRNQVSLIIKVLLLN